MNELMQRWETFVGKVKGRMQEVLAEADAGFDEVMEIDVIDPAAMSGASSAFEARVRGIAKKVEESWEKIEKELDQLIDAADDPVLGQLTALREQQSDRARELQWEMELEAKLMIARKEAKAARILGERAKKEMAEPRPCPKCGGELAVTVKHTASSVTCKFCRAVTSVVTGMATGMYYQGAAMHQLGHDAALEQWVAMEREERRYKSIREPRVADLQRYEDATIAYWRRYCDTIGTLHPDWDAATIDAQYRGKMGHFYMWKNREEVS
jgi:hypothetical protein